MFIIKKRELNFLIMYQDLLVLHVACSKVLYENMGSVLFLCIYQSPSKKVLQWAPLIKQKLRFEPVGYLRVNTVQLWNYIKIMNS